MRRNLSIKLWPLKAATEVIHNDCTYEILDLWVLWFALDEDVINE